MYFPNEIGEDGYPYCADKVFRDNYPPIPKDAKEFVSPNGVTYQAGTVNYWQFSETHKEWGAVVRFDDQRYYTWPKVA